MLDQYIHTAMQRAVYHMEPDDSISGYIPGFEDVSSHRSSLEACQKELLEDLEEWIFFRVSRQLPLPELDGIRVPETRIN